MEERRLVPSRAPIRAALAAGMAATTLIYAGCGRKEETVSDEGRSQPSVERVAREPEAFEGKRLTLYGEVDDVTGPQVFQLSGQRDLFGRDLLVLTRSAVTPGGQALEEDQHVVVTGTVRRLVVSEVERELGWDLQPELESEWRDQHVLVADTVQRVEASARWSEEGDERGGTLVGFTAIREADDARELAGRSIVLENVQVQAQAGKGYWLGFNPQQQLFVVPREASQVQVGQRVDVRGTVRQMLPPAEAMQRWQFEAALPARIAAEPIYVEAASITPAAHTQREGQQAARQGEQAEGQQAAAGQTEAEQRAARAGREGERAAEGHEGHTVPYAEFRQNPESHTGAQVTTEAEVTQVIENRALLLRDDDGRSLLAIVREQREGAAPADVPERGERVRLTGTALGREERDQLAEDAPRSVSRLLEREQAAVAVSWNDVQEAEAQR